MTDVINLGPLCGQLMSRTKKLVVYAGEHYVNPNGPEAALAIQRLAATVNAYGAEISRLQAPTATPHLLNLAADRLGSLVKSLGPCDHDASICFCEETQIVKDLRAAAGVRKA